MDPRPVTRILTRIDLGDAGATENLLVLLYDELRKLAAARLRELPPGQTLQPTALVHEAYLRLLGGEEVSWDHRGHFFSAAARTMRNILVDQARRKSRRKHGGELQRETLRDVDADVNQESVDLIALDEALRELEVRDEFKSRVVNLRYFAGLSIDDTAAALDVSPASVDRAWRYARAWLRRRIAGDDER